MKKTLLICGVDEAGRGALVGEVVAAAVVFGAPPPAGLRDSKKLSPAQREILAVQIREHCLAYCVASATVEEIEQYNIRTATMFAMQRAVDGIIVCPDKVEVDGDFAPDFPYPAEAIIGGDDKVEAIMAASILAKTSRDQMMVKLDEKYPHYGFAQHKGYPTKYHLQMLEQYGICPEHRRGYAPVKAVLAQQLQLTKNQEGTKK
ncbi:MAG: ribonuclease HII [Proteobacteria bacterium]|nr:ribonuclease HII [Pseudomonadota bacterium]